MQHSVDPRSRGSAARRIRALRHMWPWPWASTVPCSSMPRPQYRSAAISQVHRARPIARESALSRPEVVGQSDGRTAGKDKANVPHSCSEHQIASPALSLPSTPAFFARSLYGQHFRRIVVCHDVPPADSDSLTAPVGCSYDDSSIPTQNYTAAARKSRAKRKADDLSGVTRSSP
jgi:hypothetical protein